MSSIIRARALSATFRAQGLVPIFTSAASRAYANPPSLEPVTTTNYAAARRVLLLLDMPAHVARTKIGDAEQPECWTTPEGRDLLVACETAKWLLGISLPAVARLVQSRPGAFAAFFAAARLGAAHADLVEILTPAKRRLVRAWRHYDEKQKTT